MIRRLPNDEVVLGQLVTDDARDIIRVEVAVWVNFISVSFFTAHCTALAHHAASFDKLSSYILA